MLKKWHVFVVCGLMSTYGILNAILDKPERSGDTLYTYALADSLLEGKGYGTACRKLFLKQEAVNPWLVDAFRAPLGPVFYALTRVVLPKTFLSCKLINVIIVSCIFPWLAYAIGKALFGDRRIAAGAAVMVAFHPLLFESSLACAHDLLFTVLLLTSFLFFLKGIDRPINLIGCGCALGLAYLAKETAVFWALAYGGVLIWVWRRDGKFLWKRRIVWGACGALGMALCMVLWEVWSLHVDPRSSVSENDGMGLVGYAKLSHPHIHRIPLWWCPPSHGWQEIITKRNGTAIAVDTSGSFLLSANHLWLGIFIPGISHLCFIPDFSLPYYGLSVDVLKRLQEAVQNRNEPADLQQERNWPAGVMGRILGIADMAARGCTTAGVLDTVAGRSLYVGIIGVLSLVSFWRYRADRRILATLMILVVVLGLHALIQHIAIRYFLFHFIVVCIVAAKILLNVSPRKQWYFGGMLAVASGLALLFTYRDWQCPSSGSLDNLKREIRLDRLAVASWLSYQTNMEQMVVMCDAPIWIYAYSRVPTIVTPYSPLREYQIDVLVDVMRTYGVTHVIVPRQSNQFNYELFAPLLERSEEHPGWLILRHETSGSRVYQLNWSKAPDIHIRHRHFSPEEISL